MKIKWHLFYILLLLGTFGGMLYFYFASSSTAESVSRKTELFLPYWVDIDKKESTNKNDSFESQKFTGIISSQNSMDVKMPLSGVFAEDSPKISIGKSFQKGDILIKMENERMVYQLVVAREEYKKLVREFLSKIEENYPDVEEKWWEFYHNIDGAAFLPDFPVLQTEKELVEEHQLEPAFYKVKQIEEMVRNHYFSAPFDGNIIALKNRNSNTVLSNETLFTIAEKNKLEITASLPLEILPGLKNKNTVFYNSKNDSLVIGKLYNWETILSDSSTVRAFFKIQEVVLPVVFGEIVTGAS